MNTNDLNTALYEKMAAEQDKFRDWLKSQPPEEVLNHAYYNSISFAFTELCGRSYGGGVLEILPGEVGNIYVPKLDMVPIEEIRDLLEQIDSIVRNNQNIEDALDIVDKKILVDILGFEQKVCADARSIWKKLQRRRLNRG